MAESGGSDETRGQEPNRAGLGLHASQPARRPKLVIDKAPGNSYSLLSPNWSGTQEIGRPAPSSIVFGGSKLSEVDRGGVQVRAVAIQPGIDFARRLERQVNRSRRRIRLRGDGR